MARLTIQQLGPILKERRGNRGIRAVAAEIGISPATLSRVETGKQPDLETFGKICRWLEIDASEVLGCTVPSRGENLSQAITGQPVYAHFRAERTMSSETAHRLGELILAVQAALGGEVKE